MTEGLPIERERRSLGHGGIVAQDDGKFVDKDLIEADLAIIMAGSRRGIVGDSALGRRSTRRRPSWRCLRTVTSTTCTGRIRGRRRRI